MNLRNNILAILFLLPGLCIVNGADMTMPVEPRINDPSESVKKAEEKGWTTLGATVIFASGTRLEGQMAFPAGEFVIAAGDTHDGLERRVPLRDIAGLKVLRWRMKREKGGAFTFLPADAVLLLKNGDEYRVTGLALFHRIRFIHSGKRADVYTLFYAYRKNNRWVEYDSADMNWPETHPNGRTVVEIRFRESESGTEAGVEILKKFLK